MTETLFETPPPPPPSQPGPPPTVRLVRDPHDKVVAGVCAGLGRTTGTDPVLWRVTLAVLAVFGGVGLVLYLLAWLLVPRADAPESLVERVVRGGSIPTAATVVLAVLAVVVLLGFTPDSSGPLALLALGGLAVLVTRERRAARAPVPPTGPQPTVAHAAAYEPPPYVAPPPRERSRLGWATCSVALLVVGVLLLLGEAGVDGVTPPRVLVAALLVVGAGLLVGTWYGRARWLLLPGVVLALAASGASAAEGSYGWEAGERDWAPSSEVRDFRLGLGRAVLDLSDLRAGDRPVRAEVGVGELVVLVPDDLPVRLSTEVDEGDIVLREPDGSRTEVDGDVNDAPGRPVVVDLSVRVGEIEVRRVAA